MCNQPSGGGNRKTVVQNQQYLLCFWQCKVTYHLKSLNSARSQGRGFPGKGLMISRSKQLQEDDHLACWTVHWWSHNYDVKTTAHSLAQAGLWGMKGSDFWKMRDTTLDWSLLEIRRNMSPERIQKWVLYGDRLGYSGGEFLSSEAGW